MWEGREDLTANGRHKCSKTLDTTISATIVSVEPSLMKHPTDRETTPMTSTDERTVPSARKCTLSPCEHCAAEIPVRSWRCRRRVAERPSISKSSTRQGKTILQDTQTATWRSRSWPFPCGVRRVSKTYCLQAYGKPCDAGLVAAIRETGRLLCRSANRARPASGEKAVLTSD